MASTTRRLALCAASRRPVALAGREIAVTGASNDPPEWIELVPPGPEVNAIDGRKFRNSRPEQIVKAFASYGLDVPVDEEHSTEKLAPEGREAPATGWIKELEVRQGAVWGRVEWTPRGAAYLRAKEYRYVSPAFMHESDGEIVELVSAGLTNRPAFTQLAAVAQNQGSTAGAQPPPATGEHMDLKKLLALLGLAENATEEQALAACRALKDSAAELTTARSELAVARAQAQTPDLTKFAPRPELQAALARAETAEKQIADQKADAHKKNAEAAVAAAMRAGKIAPAAKDFYLATCSTEDGLAKFNEFVANQAPIVDPGKSALDGKTPPAADAGTATETELAIATRCGLSREAFVAAKKAQAS